MATDGLWVAPAILGAVFLALTIPGFFSGRAYSLFKPNLGAEQYFSRDTHTREFWVRQTIGLALGIGLIAPLIIVLVRHFMKG